MSIIVTGAAGFIGSNLLQALNRRGETDIIAVDDLTDGEQFRNLADADIADYLDQNDFLERYARGDFGTVRALFHQGACASTLESNGRYMMENNYRYSCRLLESSLELGVPFLYASSAAVYGSGRTFREARQYERPLNVYGYSKFLFDQRVRRALPQARSQVVGLRYSTSTGRARNTRGGWPRWPTTATSNCAATGGSNCSANTAASARRPPARLRRGGGRGAGKPAFLRPSAAFGNLQPRQRPGTDLQRGRPGGDQ